MLEDVLQALRRHPAFALLAPDDLELLPGKGTAHGHLRLRSPVGGRRLLARVCYAWPGDDGAAVRLQVQANAFRHAEPSGSTPRLHAVIEPTPALPGGILVVAAIDGHAPRLPQDLDSIADTLASIHAVPLPPQDDHAALPRHDDPFGRRLHLVQQNFDLYLARAGLPAAAIAEIEEELAVVRRLAPRQRALAPPPSFLLTDTHPGNFLVDRHGKAWFVDLEKVMIGGGIACDLAHATLYTSTRWDPDVDAALSLEQTRAFYRRYLDRQPAALQAALAPTLLPARRLIWLRTTAFCVRWKVETAQPRDPANPHQWSASGLDARTRHHLDSVLADLMSADTMRRIRSEWLENRLVV